MPEYAVGRYEYQAQFPGLDRELVPKIRQVLLRGGYVLGPEVRLFEQSFAQYLGVREAVGVNSGTDALILALDALGIGPGDEVITVANTFHATVMAIIRVGATPVIVDCRPDTYLLDLEQAQAAISERTKAIIPVHLFGQAMDMRSVMALADKYELMVVEDCAQAIGARSDSTLVGTQGHVACWSFAPAKNLACAGDGGMVSTNDEGLADRLRSLRNFGQSKNYEHQLIGYNSRLDGLQALVLTHKLPFINIWNAQRAVIARRYKDQLGHLPVRFQEGAAEGEHVYHLFQLETVKRDHLLAFLRRQSIDVVIRYPSPIHLQPAFAHLRHRFGEFPVAERLAKHTLCLPLFPSMREEQIDLVCKAVADFFHGGLNRSHEIQVAQPERRSPFPSS